MALFGRKSLIPPPNDSAQSKQIVNIELDPAAKTGALIVFSERQSVNRSDSDFCSDVYVQLTSHFDETSIGLWPTELRFLVAVLEYAWRVQDGGHEMFLSDESFALGFEADVIGGLRAVSALSYADLFEQFCVEFHCLERIFGQNRKDIRVAFSNEYLIDLDHRVSILNRATSLDSLIRKYICQSKLFQVVPDVDHQTALREASRTLVQLAGPNRANVPVSESLSNTLIALSDPLQRAIFLLCVQAGIEIKDRPDVFHKTISRNDLIGGRKVKLFIDINGHHYLMRVNWQGATLESAERQGFGGITRPHRYLATLRSGSINDLIERL